MKILIIFYERREKYQKSAFSVNLRHVDHVALRIAKESAVFRNTRLRRAEITIPERLAVAGTRGSVTRAEIRREGWIQFRFKARRDVRARYVCQELIFALGPEIRGEREREGGRGSAGPIRKRVTIARERRLAGLRERLAAERRNTGIHRHARARMLELNANVNAA